MAEPYTRYYTDQAGHGLPVFAGARTQRGHGIGSILGGLARMVLPLAKEVLPVVKRHAIRTGARVVGDLIEGRTLKSSARKRALQVGEEAFHDIINPPPTRRRRRSDPATAAARSRNTPIKRSAARGGVIARRGRGKRNNKQSSDIFN